MATSFLKIAGPVCWLSCFVIQVCSQTPLDTLSYLKNNPNVYSILVSKNDRLIYKKYYNGYSDTSRFNDQSLTKSIVSLLMGIAIEKGFVKSADEKLADFFPELNSDSDKRKSTISIREVMNQASGLYHEDLADIDGFLQLPQPSAYVIHAPLVTDPGKTFHYNNAATHLLSVVLTKATGMDTRSFAEKFLFGPMQIRNFNWLKLRDGYYDGCGLLSIRLSEPDMIKIGLLVLHHGKYEKKQLVSESWIREIFSPIVSYPTPWGFDHSIYGLCWYHANYHQMQLVYGLGWGGQFLVIIPGMNAVVAISENTANASAIAQSEGFVNKVFPVIFKVLQE